MCSGRVIFGHRTEYDSNNRPVATFRMATLCNAETAWELGQSESTATVLANAISIPEYRYRYDSWGNVSEVSFNGTVLASYIWAYNGLYPIAEIKGMGYDELCAALLSGAKPGDLIDRSDIGSSEMNTIRSAAQGHAVSTFTYHWLLGMASATDSRGITTPVIGFALSLLEANFGEEFYGFFEPEKNTVEKSNVNDETDNDKN